MIHIVFNKFNWIRNDKPNVVKQNHLNQNREDTYVSEKRFMLRRHLSLCLLFACIWRDADGDLLMRGIRGGSGEYNANHWICQQGAHGKKLKQIILSIWLSLQALYFALHRLSSDKHINIHINVLIDNTTAVNKIVKRFCFIMFQLQHQNLKQKV